MYGSTEAPHDAPAPRAAPQRVRRRCAALLLLKMATSKIVLGVSLVLAIGTIVYQRVSIVQLQNDASNIGRNRRALSNDIYEESWVPVEARVTQTQLMALCSTFFPTSPSKTDSTREPKRRKSKKCQAAASFTAPKNIATRLNKIGAALKDGNQWYTLEYHLGYSVLTFLNESELAANSPADILTLPYPYHGTDATVHNRTMIYLFGDSIISYNLNNRQTKHYALRAHEEPLFSLSESKVDINVDEHGLWVLYREIGTKVLTAVRLHTRSLKELGKWTVPFTSAQKWRNSFIRCGILYSLASIGSQTEIAPKFDFYTGKISNDEALKMIWNINSTMGIGSAQFDPISGTINLFVGGNIYSSTVRR